MVLFIFKTWNLVLEVQQRLERGREQTKRVGWSPSYTALLTQILCITTICIKFGTFNYVSMRFECALILYNILVHKYININKNKYIDRYIGSPLTTKGIVQGWICIAMFCHGLQRMCL